MENNDRITKSNPILKVENLHVSYGKIAALKGISFEIYKGEIVSVLGANGAGKSTTLDAICGPVNPKDGNIIFNGVSIKGKPTNKVTQMGIVHVPEGRRIFPALSVRENLRIAAYLYENKDKKLFDERIERVFDLFPRLKEREEQAGGTLSGGEQQMLAIGRAIVTGGDILLLDEPSMGLAPNLVTEIFGIIKKIAQEGQTIMLVEQNAMMAMEISDYCYVLETGTMVFEGEPSKLKGDKKIAEAYLG